MSRSDCVIKTIIGDVSAARGRPSLAVVGRAYVSTSPRVSRHWPQVARRDPDRRLLACCSTSPCFRTSQIRQCTHLANPMKTRGAPTACACARSCRSVPCWRTCSHGGADAATFYSTLHCSGVGYRYDHVTPHSSPFPPPFSLQSLAPAPVLWPCALHGLLDVQTCFDLLHNGWIPDGPWLHARGKSTQHFVDIGTVTHNDSSACKTPAERTH